MQRVVIALSLIFALWLYGGRVVHPASHAWLMQGDPAQHFLGAVFFLAEPWHWPPGLITRFGDVPTSVVFTDSIPLLALPAKLLGWPAHWQYLGLWMVACHVLSGVFALRLMLRLGPAVCNRAALVAAALFFVVAPVLLLRAYGHEALMGQFLVLAALERALAPWRFVPWLLLVAVAVRVHPYLALMCAVIGLGAAIAALRTREARLPQLAGQGAIACIMLGALAWIAGYFAGSGQVAAAGHGFFSANAITWFDPMNWHAFTQTHQRAVPYDAEWSRRWPPLAQATGGQYEGFAFLGLGMLALLVIAVAIAIAAVVTDADAGRKSATTGDPVAADLANDARAARVRLHTLWGVALLLALWAWSLRPSIGDHVLADLPAPALLEPLLGTFRASGRFIWPLTYLVMAWALMRVLQWRARLGAALVIVALAVQVSDLRPKLQELRTRFRIGPPGIEQPVGLPAWQALFKRCPRLEILSEALPPPGWIGPSLAAALSDARIEPAPTARRSAQADAQRLDDVRRLIATHSWRADTVYLLAQPLPGASADAILAALPPSHEGKTMDGRTLVVPRACSSN